MTQTSGTDAFTLGQSGGSATASATGNLASGSSDTFTVVVFVPYTLSNGASFNDTASVSASNPDPNPAKPIKEDAARFPLRKVWEKWLAERPKALRDKDGLELLRAFLWCHLDEAYGKAQIKQYGTEWRAFLKDSSAGHCEPDLLFLRNFGYER